jgi:hypothetical protein
MAIRPFCPVLQAHTHTHTLCLLRKDLIFADAFPFQHDKEMVGTKPIQLLKNIRPITATFVLFLQEHEGKGNRGGGGEGEESIKHSNLGTLFHRRCTLEAHPLIL